jgi:hypothetical protein
MATFTDAFFPGGAITTFLQLGVLYLWVSGWWRQFKGSGDGVNSGELLALVLFGSMALFVSAMFLHGALTMLEVAGLPRKILS